VYIVCIINKYAILWGLNNKHIQLIFLGDVCLCHVIFAGKGISSNMASKEAVENIKNLLISSTEKGSQNHNSLLECYKLFDK
jgi:hypothetical protein